MNEKIEETEETEQIEDVVYEDDQQPEDAGAPTHDIGGPNPGDEDDISEGWTV